MGYYFLTPSVEKGRSATISHKDEGFLFLKDSQSDLDYFEFPDFEPIFSGINLTKGSVLVDFIYDGGGFGGTGFIVSEKAMNVLKDFTLPPHRFYRLPDYIENGKSHMYYWLQILVKDTNHDFIDFKDSVFQIDFWEPERSQEFRFANADEMSAAHKKYNMPDEELYTKEIALSEAFYSRSPDLFYIDFALQSFMISEELKNALEKNNITGLTDFYESMPPVKGNSPSIVRENEPEVVELKEIFVPEDISEVHERLDFIFGQMDADDDAIYTFEAEIDACLTFLSETENPILPIFELLEKYPDAMHGSPGAFVHYLEGFYQNGLEEILKESSQRSPNFITINMLYRIASDKENPERTEYKKLLESLTDKKKYDEYIVGTAQDCIADL